jgi:hypothetical protein
MRTRQRRGKKNEKWERQQVKEEYLGEDRRQFKFLVSFFHKFEQRFVSAICFLSDFIFLIRDRSEWGTQQIRSKRQELRFAQRDEFTNPEEKESLRTKEIFVTNTSVNVYQLNTVSRVRVSRESHWPTRIITFKGETMRRGTEKKQGQRAERTMGPRSKCCDCLISIKKASKAA